MTEKVHEQVSEYYGKVLQKTEDLKTGACCTAAPLPKFVRDYLAKIHDDVTSKYYGCGLVIPPLLKGCKVLDLGSGSGRDCYLCQGLVGENGHVVGVDMTDEQLDVSRKYIQYHTDIFGYSKVNIEFKKGHIENLKEVELEDNFFDVIISNCVINLANDKEAVLREAHRTLKNGGEMYFSDVYSDRRIPKSLKNDPVLYGECLSGALYYNDFVALAKKVGFNDPRLVEAREIDMNNEEIQKKTEGYKFYSMTYRLMKIPQLESGREDYGISVTYLGTIEECPEKFILDDRITLVKGEKKNVDGNTARILKYSRYAHHFQIDGTFCTHLGEFDQEQTVQKRLKLCLSSSCC